MRGAISMKKTIQFFYAICCIVVMAGPSSAAAAWVDCTPANVATFAGRVHVKCVATVSGGIQYFAVASSDTAFANRFMSIASSALVAGRTLSVLFDAAD